MLTLRIQDKKTSKRSKDANGFLIIKDNPIAKAGVFDYLLSELKEGINPKDDKVVKVYRPFSELIRVKDSFSNKPIKMFFNKLEAYNEFDPIVDIASNSYLTSFYSGNVNEQKINHMLDYVKKYDVDTKPERVFDLEHVADAHRYLENSKSFGKAVVVEH